MLIGGLSPLGLMMAAVTATASALGNAQRRADAMRDAAPRWRYVASGTVRVADNRWLVVVDETGASRTFDLDAAHEVDLLAADWVRIQPTPGGMPWALQFLV